MLRLYLIDDNNAVYVVGHDDEIVQIDIGEMDWNSYP